MKRRYTKRTEVLTSSGVRAIGSWVLERGDVFIRKGWWDALKGEWGHPTWENYTDYVPRAKWYQFWLPKMPASSLPVAKINAR